MVADMTKAGRGFNHPDLARKFAENAVNICPMLDECGVQLMDKVIRLGGHSAPRTMVPTAASGGGIVVPIHNWLKKNGVQFRNRSQVIDLLMQDSKVTGYWSTVITTGKTVPLRKDRESVPAAES